MLAVQLCCARHCELPLSKMGNKGLFPGVAVPLAFFCTLFFRHRKKSVSAPWDGKSQSAPESARQAPSRGIFHGKVVAYRCKQGGFPLAPLHPLRFATRNNRVPHGTASPNSRRSRRVRPHQRGIPSAGVSLCGASMCFPQYTPHPQKTTGMFPNTPVVFR